MKGKILILDDNKSVLTALEMLLQTEFESVFCLSNPATLLSAIKEHNIDIVLLDMNFRAGINNGNEGIFWLKEIQKCDSTISVVMITAFGDIELAVKAVKKGAFDFILKPWDNNKLISTLHAAMKLRKSKIENISLKNTTTTLKQELKQASQSIIGQSAPMKSVMDMVKKVAKTDANIFITGENGTGKELIAREIHKYSETKQRANAECGYGVTIANHFLKASFSDIQKVHLPMQKKKGLGNLKLQIRVQFFLMKLAIFLCQCRLKY